MAWFNMPMGAPNQDADLANLSGNTRTPTQSAFGRGMGIFGQAQNLNAQRQDDNIANLSGNTRNVGGVNVMPQQQAMPLGAGLSTSAQMAMAPKVLTETPEDTMFKMRGQIQGMQYQRQANPWGQNNPALENLRQSNRGMIGGGLQSALLDQRRNVAQRGITQDSGLAQNQDLQARLAAAKGLSQMDTAANTDYYNRAAQFDQSQNEAMNEFERWKAQALMSGDVNQAQYGLQRLGQMNEQAMMPGRLEAQGYSNREAQTRLGYLAPSLEQSLQGQRYGNEDARTRLGYLAPSLEQQLQQQRYQTQGAGYQNQIDAANMPAYIDELKYRQQMAPYTRSREMLNNSLEDYLRIPKAAAPLLGKFAGMGG